MIRAYVADTGSDSSSGSAAYPFLTLAYAMTQITDGGEIIVMDDGIYAPSTIDKSVQIDASRGARVSVSSGNAINVTAVGGKRVELMGLSMLGHAVGSIGVNATGGADLAMTDCRVDGFSAGSAIGINYAPPAGSVGKLDLVRLRAARNGNLEFNGAVLVKPNLTGSAKVTITDAQINDNSCGVIADGDGNSVCVDVAILGQSRFLRNDWHAVFATSETGAPTRVFCDGMFAAYGTLTSHHAAIRIYGLGATVLTKQCSLFKNWYSVWQSGPSGVTTYGKWISCGGNIFDDVNATETPYQTRAAV